MAASGAEGRSIGLALDVAKRLISEEIEVAPGCAFVAPTLLRSDLLAWVYALERDGTLTRAEAIARLDRMRGLRVRLLGDRVSQRRSMEIAAALGRADTYAAEYIAVASLQAEVLVTTDTDLAREAVRFVRVAGLDALVG